ncbi:DUF4352 domain-containing protein [Streptomyces sp. NPDC056773]|uniref:DUF4352 domain-containing protein n=1 Tax=unclassified Streptomyces TaxID=2593676 RepID=UPI003691162A
MKDGAVSASASGSVRRGADRPGPAGRPSRPLTVLAALAALLLGPALPAAAGHGPDASGETVSLTGTAPGERLDVTLTRVVDPAGPGSGPGPTPGPAPGDADRLVSVQLRLENTGTAVYEDSPAASTHLLDSDGRRFDGLGASAEAHAAFPPTVTLGPGSTVTGSVGFRVPKDAELAAVQFALDGGLANDVGQWSLP